MANALSSAYSSPRPEPYSMSAAQDRQLAGSPSIPAVRGQKLRAGERGPRSTPRPPLQPNALQVRCPVRSPYSVQVAPPDRPAMQVDPQAPSTLSPPKGGTVPQPLHSGNSNCR